MRKLISLTLALLAVSASSYASVLFHGGDQTEISTVSSAMFISGPGESGTMIFDDFMVSDAGWQVNTVRLYVISNVQFAPMFGQIEIRSGVSSGVGGSVIYEDEGATASALPTGRSFAGRLEYEMTIIVPDVMLTSGTYWLGIRPFGSVYTAPSSGANAVGTPTLNDQSYARSVFAQYNYKPIRKIVGLPSFDMSFKVEGTAVPEPLSLASLGFGVVGVFRLRHRAVRA